MPNLEDFLVITRLWSRARHTRLAWNHSMSAKRTGWATASTKSVLMLTATAGQMLSETLDVENNQPYWPDLLQQADS
jgi:hypothetical protein